MKRENNIILYYLIDSDVLSHDLENKIIKDLNTNYSSQERKRIISAIDQSIQQQKITLEMPGINFSEEEILKFLSRLYSKL